MPQHMPVTLRTLRLPALLLLAFLSLFVFAAQAQAMKCDGKKVTIKGTAGDDKIVGKKASDVIWGGSGRRSGRWWRRSTTSPSRPTCWR